MSKGQESKSLKKKYVKEEPLDELESDEEILSDFALEDDPEYEDFGSALDAKSSRKRLAKPIIQGDKDESRRHYQNLSVKKGVGQSRKIPLPIDDEEFMDGKYAGRKVSKLELGLSQEESPETFKEEESVSEAESWLSFVEQKIDNQDKVGFEGREEHFEKELKASREMQIQMISQKLQDDTQRGQQVREQLNKWQKAIGARIQMQPLIRAIQKLCNARNVELVVSNFIKDETSMAIQKKTKNMLTTIIKGFLPAEVAEKITENSLDSLEHSLKSFDKTYTDIWKKSLDAWHEKANLSTISNQLATEDSLKNKKKSKTLMLIKNMKVINQTPWVQVEGIMRDRERLLRKHIKRGDEDNSKVWFDDGEFFTSLVREWTGTVGEGEQEIIGKEIVRVAGLVVSRIDTKPHRDGIDPRASKGRKLRYDVQDKLINYMVPIMDPYRWTDDKIDAFYETIFKDTSLVFETPTIDH